MNLIFWERIYYIKFSLTFLSSIKIEHNLVFKDDSKQKIQNITRSFTLKLMVNLEVVSSLE
jgi:hypothetical protein